MKILKIVCEETAGDGTDQLDALGMALVELIDSHRYDDEPFTADECMGLLQVFHETAFESLMDLFYPDRQSGDDDDGFPEVVGHA